MDTGDRGKRKERTLITADFALDQGKDVYALPGPVTSALSQGCHRLIRQGAGILITPEELMDEWNLNRMQMGQKNNKMKKCLKVLSVWCIVVSICSRKELMN